MKKVLFICYDWPPSQGVGWIRTFKFAKFLSRFGWEPTIVTASLAHSTAPTPWLSEWDHKAPLRANPELVEGLGVPGDVSEGAGSMRVVRTGSRDILSQMKKRVFGAPESSASGDRERQARTHRVAGKSIARPMLQFAREMIAMPDEQIGWKPVALTAVSSCMSEGRFDAIVSTSPPETAHLVAYEIKKRYGIPWVADLRDLWSGYHFYYRGLAKTLILRMMERKVLGAADAVVTVSEPWADELRTALTSHARNGAVYAITNGYDEEDYSPSSGVSSRGYFRILYTGKLHKDIQDPTVFFASVRELIDEGKIDRSLFRGEFYIYGYDKPDIAGIAERYHLADCISEHKTVPHKRCMELLTDASALLLFGWSGRGAAGHYPAKVFEYIGARHPVIAIVKTRPSAVEELIRKTRSGVVAGNKEELKTALERLYGDFVTYGTTRFDGDDSEIRRYTRIEKTKELAGVLDRVYGRGVTS